MILAAGRGQRMRPLTDAIPKPLLEVGGKPLIVWQIEALVAAGFDDLVINHAWLGARLEDALGDGARWGARIAWSREGEALETAGGIVTALPLIEEGDGRDRPFVVVSGDIHSDFDYTTLRPMIESIVSRYPVHAAHLVLVDNPSWHAQGDMALVDGKIVAPRDGQGRPMLTYANIAVFHPRVFDGLAPHRSAKLFPWSYALADAGRMTGTRFDGEWDNVGTSEQLAALDGRLRNRQVARHG
jgi:N-acetyl-alpha-D-muramate 1-phosphate uridylyltransferase